MNYPAPITHTITVELDADTIARVEALATARGVSAAQFATDAIRRVAISDAHERAFVQLGIDAADRGELTSQAEVFENLRLRRQHRDAA